MSKFTIVGLGEVLWDVFPTHKQLGGAPANFAYISGLLGDDGIVASRIGGDALGDEVVARLTGLGLDVASIQRDTAHATGTVKVEVAGDGQPRFEITKNVAWDFLEWTPQLQALAARTDAVCFGSLAQRGLQSRETIHQFVAATREKAVRVFDVNLRQAFYSAEVLSNSAESADILKLNHEEVPVVLQAVGGPRVDELRSAQWLCRRFGLKLVCVTRGRSGSLLVTKGAHAEHPGFEVQVVDTVGAGDAFTATLVHHYLRGSDLATMNDAANQMGAWVASTSGATPAMEAEQIKRAQAS
jgi:fructokinase